MIIDVRMQSPVATLFSDKAHSITLTATDGQYQILPNHAPMFLTLAKGAIVIQKSKETYRWVGEGGSAHVQNNSCTINVLGAITEDSF